LQKKTEGEKHRKLPQSLCDSSLKEGAIKTPSLKEVDFLQKKTEGEKHRKLPQSLRASSLKEGALASLTEGGGFFAKKDGGRKTSYTPSVTL